MFIFILNICILVFCVILHLNKMLCCTSFTISHFSHSIIVINSLFLHRGTKGEVGWVGKCGTYANIFIFYNTSACFIWFFHQYNYRNTFFLSFYHCDYKRCTFGVFYQYVCKRCTFWWFWQYDCNGQCNRCTFWLWIWAPQSTAMLVHS